MTPCQFAKSKLIDNCAFMEKYVGGKHVKFLAFLSAIVDCDIQLEGNKDNEKELLYYYSTKVYLVQQFESYCLTYNYKTTITIKKLKN